MNKARLMKQFEELKKGDFVRFRIVKIMEVRASVIPENMVVFCKDEYGIPYKLIMEDEVFEQLVRQG